MTRLRSPLARTLRCVALVLACASATGCHGRPDEAAPGPVASVLTLAGADEPGRRLVLVGQVFDEDGTTPLPGAILEVYHTDDGGMYTRPRSVARNARLRGEVSTDTEGRYEIRTILPGKYPSGGEAAHVHVHLEAPGVPAHWIPSYRFAGDPELEAEEVRTEAERGTFASILELEEREDGVLLGRRDIRLDRDLADRNRLVDGWYRGE